MKKLNLPEYSFRITSEGNRLLIYDTFRKKKVVLTPEEWVRQNILMFLVREKKYPVSLISIESGIKVNQLIKRYDALVYNRQGNPVMLIECKAPEVAIRQDTFDQISAYNLSVIAQFLLISNGMKHFCCKLNEFRNSYNFLNEIPSFHEL